MNFKRHDIILFLFLLNVIVTVTAGFFTGMMHIGVIRALLMIALIPLLIIDGVRLTWAGMMIILCLAYLIILTPFSSDPVMTADYVLKVALGLLMFPMAYNYLRGDEARRKLANLVPVCLSLFFIAFLIAQIFGIGTNPYYEDGLNAGGGNIQQTYLIAYLLLFLPILGFFRNRPFRSRWWEGAIYLMALFPLALIGRRGAILGFLIGVVIYAIITPRKGRVVVAAACAVLVAMATLPLYIDHVHGVMEHRTENTDSVEEIGRVQEIMNSLATLRDGSIRHMLFGQELFNYHVVTRDGRDLHTDYAAYFLGSGLVGFFLYFSIIPALWFDFWRRILLIRNPYVVREISAVFIGLTVAFIVISFSGQYYVVSSLAVVCSIWGAMLAYLEEAAVPQEIAKDPEEANLETANLVS